MTLFHAKKKKASLSGIFSLLLLLAVLFAFVKSVDSIQTANDAEQAKILENALTRSITECYALEGAYPPNLAYLTEHYGLVYDTEQYFIDYRYIGANLRPDVTIIKKDDSL